MLKIIKTNDANHFVSIRRACFLNWKEYVDRRRRCCHLLSRAVFMMLAQRTFTEIKDFSRANETAKGVAKGSKCIFNLWHRCLLRKAYNKWRVSNYAMLRE